MFTTNFRIVAIGGGKSFQETDTINRQILKMTKKRNPKILFLPTASGDASRYILSFASYFTKLGAIPSVLPVVHESIDPQEIEKIISETDAIYVGGGSTLKMIKLWRKKGIDGALLRAAKRGVVLSGLSAGANCWFELAHSVTKTPPKHSKYEYRTVKGLGLVTGYVCPHFCTEKHRHQHFIASLKKKHQKGIAIDDLCAMVIDKNSIQIIGENRNVGIKFFRKGHDVVKYPAGTIIKQEDIFGE